MKHVLLKVQIVFLTTFTLLATSAAAANLLKNPDFDLDPTNPANGWTAVGNGTLSHNVNKGDLAPPSARCDNTEVQSLTLQQCVGIVGGTPYDFSARSFTHLSTGEGVSTNSVSVSFFSSSDCTDDFLSNVPTDTGSFPNWALREAKGVLAPANANSARIELNAEATGAGTIMNISWDNVILDGLSPPGLESSDQLYFAHFGNGQGFTSDTVLTNPSPTRTAAGTVSYSDDDGNPLPVGFASAGDGIVPLAIASSVNFSIPPLGAPYHRHRRPGRGEGWCCRCDFR